MLWTLGTSPELKVVVKVDMTSLTPRAFASLVVRSGWVTVVGRAADRSVPSVPASSTAAAAFLGTTSRPATPGTMRTLEPAGRNRASLGSV